MGDKSVWVVFADTDAANNRPHVGVFALLIQTTHIFNIFKDLNLRY